MQQYANDDRCYDDYTQDDEQITLILRSAVIFIYKFWPFRNRRRNFARYGQRPYPLDTMLNRRLCALAHYF